MLNVKVLSLAAVLLLPLAVNAQPAAQDWEVTLGARFQNVTAQVERIAPKLEIQSSGENWFDRLLL